MLVTCYSCNKTSRHIGVKRDFLAALSHNPNTPNSCGKRRDAARTPKSTGKGSVSHIKSGAKGKSPATTPRSTSSRPATPSPSTKPIGVKKSPFSHLKMLLNLEQKQSSKKGGLQDFLCSLWTVRFWTVWSYVQARCLAWILLNDLLRAKLRCSVHTGGWSSVKKCNTKHIAK